MTCQDKMRSYAAKRTPVIPRFISESYTSELLLIVLLRWR